MFNVLQSLLGICFLLGLALALSENRSKIPWRTVISALILQFVLAVILLKLPFSRNIFLVLNKMVFALEKATKAGTSFVFGYLGGGEIPFVQKEEGQTYILAFRGLPLILVVSALTSLLYYWRVLQVVVKGFASFLQK
ncbi:MAG TPA: Na+ dependent nucleoside transporter N-terminal domain-containing protein, partial [Desulfohalobiaceae bacterium]|nr:Na+ dependent nucleoside transporter N-terminal domain-containing protein [Desulfohalobiaceae bacterium]